MRVYHQTKKYKEWRKLKDKVVALLKADSPDNYETADLAGEGILSELEANEDLTPKQGEEVKAIVGDWFYDGENAF